MKPWTFPLRVALGLSLAALGLPGPLREESPPEPAPIVRPAEAGRAAPLDEAERAALHAAEALSPDLAPMRGGDLELNDRELKIIGVTVLAVILLIIIF